jgi:hypothetical protein
LAVRERRRAEERGVGRVEIAQVRLIALEIARLDQDVAGTRLMSRVGSERRNG